MSSFLQKEQSVDVLNKTERSKSVALWLETSVTDCFETNSFSERSGS